MTASTGPQADAARAAFRERIGREGPRGRERPARPSPGSRPRSRRARSSGRRRSTRCSPTSSVALDQDEGQRLGGKSAEAARFILRAISRELDNA